MERQLKHWDLPKLRCRKHQTHPSTLFFPIFSLAREKIGPPEARQKRPRRNESLQARLLILCARFFLSKPQTKFAVWVFSMQICGNLSVSAAPSQHPYPFCPFGTFPPDRGNRPLKGEPRGAAHLAAFPYEGKVARRSRDGEVVRRKACPRTRPMTERFTPKRYSLYTDTSLVYRESVIK